MNQFSHELLEARCRERHPFQGDIFYCHRERLVVELVGGPHRDRQGYGRARDAYLAKYGIRVLRVRNWQVRNDLPAAIAAIGAALARTP
ncbi:MAG: DUF559 domain-containing protein [Candidatus Binataceae bacterium]